MVRLPVFVVFAISASPVLAQAWDPAKLRVIASKRMDELLSDFKAFSQLRERIETDTLQRLIVTPPSPPYSFHVFETPKEKAGQVIEIWYTDDASTKPKALPVTRDENDVLYSYADGGMSKVKKLTGKSSAGEIAAALTALDADARSSPRLATALKLAGGAKFAEVFSFDDKSDDNKAAVAFAKQYRTTVLDAAVSRSTDDAFLDLLKRSKADGDPILFGKTDLDAHSIAFTAFSKSSRTINTACGKFDAVFDKSTLIFVPLGKDDKPQLNPDWLKAADPKIKSPLVKPIIDKTMFPK